MARIVLDDVSVEFPIYSSRARSIRSAVYSHLGGRLAAHDRTAVVQALSNVSLELGDGDRLGVVGHNGAGKTTFLRVVSRVYPPVSGKALVDGKISSLTDLTLGMEPEATGWQNIVFRCIFLGLTFSKAKELAPSIGEFSGLGQYLDLPVRTYSSGMYLRLAFAISTSVDADIIVMDEMVVTGDQWFIETAQKRVDSLVARSPILVLASHSLDIVKRFCTKGLWLEQGRVRMLGPIDEVIAAYGAAAAGSADPGPSKTSLAAA